MSGPRLPNWLPATAIVAVAAALGLIFLYAPTEALQGDVQRVVYVHAPAGWIAYLAFGIVAVASVLVLARPAQAARWDAISVSATETGVLFTTIVLLTGPIWGRWSWGTWWVWDARLTSTLVLWAIYAGALVFRWLTPPDERRARRAAVIGIIGALDIPIVHFSVIWWRTLHPQPTVVRPDGPALPGSMLLTLMVSLAAFTVLFGCLLVLRVALEGARARVEALERASSARSAPTRAEVQPR